MSYYFDKVLAIGFEQSIEHVRQALAKEGFGVLTDIDVSETLRKKLGVEFRKYRILGACNPALALEALKVEDKIGAMLPCNVVVQEIDSGHTEVAAIDPVASMAAVDNPQLRIAAETVRGKLRSVVDSL